MGNFQDLFSFQSGYSEEEIEELQYQMKNLKAQMQEVNNKKFHIFIFGLHTTPSTYDLPMDRSLI